MRVAHRGPIATLVVGAVAVAVGVVGSVPAAAAVKRADSHLKSSVITLALGTVRPHSPDATVTFVATLRPKGAWGAVALYDGTNLLASGHNYRIQWSYTSSARLAVGRHEFRANFTPSAASGYAPSRASVSYVVAASPTPSPTTSVSPGRTPGVRPTKDLRPIRVIQLTKTRTAPKPKPRASASAAPRAIGDVPAQTDFTEIGVIAAAGALIAVGAVLVIAGRRRRRGGRHRRSRVAG
jgi:hypothetical protein